MNTWDRRVAIVWVLVAGVSAAAWGQSARPAGGTKQVLDFENAAIWSSENQSPFECRAERVSQGAKSLRVHYTNKPKWSNIWTNRFVKDWSGFKYLNFDVYLEGDLPATLGMWVRDAAQHKAEDSWPIGPGWNTVTMDLDKMRRAAELNRAAIGSMCIYKEMKQKAEIVVHLDNMYLSVARPVAPKAEPVRMPDKELLADGGFESLGEADALGSPFRWWIGRRWQGPSFIGAGRKAVHGGKSSLMLDGRGPCKIGAYTPPIRVKSPTRLKLTAWIQGREIAKGLWGQYGAIAVTNHAESGLPGAKAAIPAGSYGWRKVEVVFAVPSRTPVVKVFVQLYGPGRLWVDDVSLVGVDLKTAAGVTIGRPAEQGDVDPPLVTESAAELAAKKSARAAMERLRAAVAAAKAKGVETLYDEVPLVLGELAFDVRWDLPEHLSLRQGYAEFVLDRCRKAVAHLKAVTAGRAPDLKVPPHPDFRKLKLKGAYYREGDEPRILFSMQYHSRGELTKWFCPIDHRLHLPAVGASRYDFKKYPVWEVYRKHPETRRVYDNGWCGHIIRDQWSAGGSDRCVISLDAPLMRQAIAASIGQRAAGYKRRSTDNVLFVNMGFEYSYVNYDEPSLKAFRAFLARKYGEVTKLNAVWKTKHESFDAVSLPPHAPGKSAANPAKYHDWGAFNLWRFTDYMKWAKGEIRKHFPHKPTTTGGGHPFGAGYWRQGIDEEALSDEGVCDLWLSETGSRALGVTSLMDLQRSLDPDKLILDPEYHALPNTCFLMFLHGCGLMHYWWWPDRVSEFYASSMRHSHQRTLLGVEAVMRTALDVRRMPAEIARFREAATEVALLYPRASLIQRFPAAQGHKTPFSLEVEKTYAAAVRLNAPVGFASSKRIRGGSLGACKLLLVPGCRFVAADVVEKVLAWVRAGGTMVITPTSLIADEYSRKRDYLNRLGIEIVAEELPKMMAGKAARGIDQEPGELDFIQGPVAKTIVTDAPKRRVAATAEGKAMGLPGELAAEGILQTVRAGKGWTALGTYAGTADAALLVRSLGRGRVIYLAGQLAVADRKALFDRVMARAGVSRPVRARAPGGAPLEGVEFRAVKTGEAYLAYLHNTTMASHAVELTAERGIAKVYNVSAAAAMDRTTMEIAPLETRILRITLK